MPYVGRTPSAVPVTADDIPANSIDASKIVDGSIELAEIADNSITDAKLNSSKLDGIETGATADQTKADIEGLGIAASSITGALPAISGANLTGINAVVVGATLPSPVSTEGSLFYKSDTDIFYISNGTQWNLVSNAAPATTGGTVTIGALSEGGTFSYDLGLDFTDDVDTDAQLTYTLVSGTMPTGCTLPTTGNSAFTGSASDVASNTNYTWTIKATDTSGGTATQDYQQTINTVAATTTGGTVVIPAVNMYVAASYDVDTDFTFTTGSTFSAYSLVSGSLPSGLTLNTSTGVISGYAPEPGNTNTTYTFTIRGTDTDGDTADQAYSWTINTIRSASKCATLGFPVGASSVSTTAECGSCVSTAGVVNGCSQGMYTWSQFKTYCTNIGARLCTQQEMLDQAPTGTGCSHDNRAIWTSTPRNDGSGDYRWECGSQSAGFAGAWRNPTSTTALGTICGGTANEFGIRCCGDTW